MGCRAPPQEGARWEGAISLSTPAGTALHASHQLQQHCPPLLPSFPKQLLVLPSPRPAWPFPLRVGMGHVGAQFARRSPPSEVSCKALTSPHGLSAWVRRAVAGTWHRPGRIKAGPLSTTQGHPRAWAVAQQGLAILSKAGLWVGRPHPQTPGLGHSSPLLTPVHPSAQSPPLAGSTFSWASGELWTIAPTLSCTPGDWRGQWGGLLAGTHTDSL